MTSKTEKEKPPLKLFIAIPIFALLMFYPDASAAPNSVSNETTLLTYQSSGQEVLKHDSNASNDVSFDGLTFKTLIKCLAFYESGYNQNAVGDDGLAIGILQFHQPTFDRYCFGDINDAQDQLWCADAMLTSDFLNVFHWTTYELFCLNK